MMLSLDIEEEEVYHNYTIIYALPSNPENILI